jgi:myosin heavy subunit
VYDVANFLSKNKDILEPDLADLLSSLDVPDGDSFANFVGQVFVETSSAGKEQSVFKKEESSRKLANLETVGGRLRGEIQVRQVFFFHSSLVTFDFR